MAVPVNYQIASANFTRPADTTAYASGDLVANSTTAGSVVPLTFNECNRGQGIHGHIRRVRLITSNTSTTNASFRLHLFYASPTVANGDNGAILFNNALKYIGQVDVTVGQTATDGAAGSATTDMMFNTNSGTTLYGLLEARAAYTPTSAEVFTAKLEIEQA
jgi:hypothetical protein